MPHRFFSILASIAIALPVLAIIKLKSRHAPSADAVAWRLIWSDEFNGTGAVSSSDWIYDTGTGYGCSGCPPTWGTGEIEVMSSSTSNVFQSDGSLNIRALHAGSNPTVGWTSGRIETLRTDFQPSRRWRYGNRGEDPAAQRRHYERSGLLAGVLDAGRAAGARIRHGQGFRS